MASLNELVTALQAAGVVLWEDHGQLAYRAPRGALTAELLAGLRAHKAALLAGLRLSVGSAPPVSAKEPRPPRLPLSSAQQRLWFVEQIKGTSPTFNILGALRLRGPLNLSALERSLLEIVRRHEVLRTTLAVVPATAQPAPCAPAAGEPQQIVHPFVPFPVPVIELQAATAPALAEAEQRHIQAEAARPFDLQRGPLFRFEVLRLQLSAPADAAAEPPEHDLLLCFHHIAVDEWSIRVLCAEISALYVDFCRGAAPALPALPLQYADYACRERSWLDSPEAEVARQFWLAQLAALPRTRVPEELPRPAVPSDAGIFHVRSLPAPLGGALRQLAQGHGATLFMVGGAALACLLHYYTREPEVVLGSNVANREDPALQPLVGFFTNQIVLRLRLAETQPFHQILASFRAAAIAAQSHQRYPIEQLMHRLAHSRDAGLGSFFDVKFEYVEASGLAPALAGLEVSQLAWPPTLTRETFDVVLSAGPGELRLELAARRDLYAPTALSRLASLLELLLTQITTDPEQSLAALCSQLAHAEQQQQRQRGEESRAAAHQKLKARQRPATAAGKGAEP